MLIFKDIIQAYFLHFHAYVTVPLSPGVAQAGAPSKPFSMNGDLWRHNWRSNMQRAGEGLPSRLWLTKLISNFCEQWRVNVFFRFSQYASLAYYSDINLWRHNWVLKHVHILLWAFLADFGVLYTLGESWRFNVFSRYFSVCKLICFYKKTTKENIQETHKNALALLNLWIQKL